MLEELHKKVIASPITTNSFHWLRWHFTAAGGAPVPFGIALLSALAEIDEHLPGYAHRTINALAALPDREKHRDDYEQVLERLAEVLVIRRLVAWGGPLGAQFVDEPVAPGSDKNPEVLVELDDLRMAVEVKTPRLADHARLRASQALQFAARVFPPEHVAEMEKRLGSATRPRDNPVKDFLRSADEKFASFKATDANTCCVLVIVWDDHAFEVMTTLLHKRVGLLTTNSWLRDDNGDAERFPNVDAVIVTGHQLLLDVALKDNPPFPFGLRGLDWEHRGIWFGVVSVGNPAGAEVPKRVEEAFVSRDPGPDETQIDMVNWVSRSPTSPLNQVDAES